ncbi:MAG: uroporphyrinogen-III synthase, partial [Verrucomicrobiota bacterium]
AVESFFETFFKAYHDAREIGGVRIAAIGPGTAAKVAEYRLSVDFVPQTAVAESFADEFVEEEGTVENQRLLWVRGEQARDVLSKKFTEGGAILDEAIAYRTVPETGDRTGSVARFREEGADVITFTSGSTVEHFLDLRLPLPENLKIVSIGPITSQALRDHGLYVDAEAEKADLRSLIDAVEKVCGVGS